MAESQDVETFKRRGRRRLVGAVALVLLAIIVLPVVFNQRPKHRLPPVKVRIPSESESGAPVEALPKLPITPSPPAVTAPSKVAAPERLAESTKPKVARMHEQAPKPKVAPKPEAAVKPEAHHPYAHRLEAAKPERARAAAALKNGKFVVPVAALAERVGVERLKARLKAAKIPYYTERIAITKGEVTQIRAGPFASRVAAERALAKLKRMGLKPGKVINKS